MGRETLVAIAEDEADQARALLERKRRSTRPPPQTPAPPAAPAVPPSSDAGRGRMVTLDYHEQPPRAPAHDSSPEIETGLKPIGRETLAAITSDLAHEMMKALSIEERSAWLLQLEEAAVIEPFRFEVRGAPMLARSDEALRREFISARLLHRLPIRSLEQVSRIDVSPTADEALTLTIWVKIPEPRA